MYFSWDSEIVRNTDTKGSTPWEDIFEYYGAKDLEPKRDDVYNKLYFINQNTLKGKVTTETGRLMNAGTAYVKKLECDVCQRIFHKEFSLAQHERKSHNNKHRREFSRISLVKELNESARTRSTGIKKPLKAEETEEEEEEDSSGDEITSDDEPEYADTTTDEDGNDSDSDIEIVASKGFKEAKKTNKGATIYQRTNNNVPTREQRYQQRLRSKVPAETKHETTNLKRRSSSQGDDDHSDSGISVTSQSPAKSRKISENDIKKMISEKDIDDDLPEETLTMDSIGDNLEDLPKQKHIAEDLIRNSVEIRSKSNVKDIGLTINKVAMREEEDSSLEYIETKTNKVSENEKDDGYDSDFEKMGGDLLPLFDPEDSNEEVILGL